MSDFTEVAIKRNPARIKNLSIEDPSVSNPNEVSDETLVVADKLMEHLRIIRDYKDRISAIDYLTDSANNLAKNLSFTTQDTKLISAISDLGGISNIVDFTLYKKAIDIMLDGYEQLALVALTGDDDA